MPVDLYIYNGGRQAIDTTSSMLDLILQAGVIVPPGAQAHVQLPDQQSYSAIVAQIENYGAVDHATVAAPASFAGVSHSTAPVAIPAKTVPIVVAPIVTKPKGK